MPILGRTSHVEVLLERKVRFLLCSIGIGEKHDIFFRITFVATCDFL